MSAYSNDISIGTNLPMRIAYFFYYFMYEIPGGIINILLARGLYLRQDTSYPSIDLSYCLYIFSPLIPHTMAGDTPATPASAQVNVPSRNGVGRFSEPVFSGKTETYKLWYNKAINYLRNVFP